MIRLRMLFFFLLVFLAAMYCSVSLADTVYLKNGRSINGLIKNEDAQALQIEVSSGTITLDKDAVVNINRSTFEQAQDLRMQWQRTRQMEQVNKAPEQNLPRSVDFSKSGGHIMVNAEFNHDVSANLLLDTGASLIVVSRQIGERLGLNMDDNKDLIPLRMANGNIAYAKRFFLKHVRVDRVDAENVEAAALRENDPDTKVGDGLLGMSFLNKFNFKVDYSREQLILEKRS